jgi:hypothetical protein
MSKRSKDRAVIRVVVKMTKPDRDALVARCEEEVRTVGSWFRLQVQRAWRSRKAPRRPPPYQRDQGDGVVRTIDVWARLTDEERDQLDVLAGDEGVSVSIWFRRRLAAELPGHGHPGRGNRARS